MSIVPTFVPMPDICMTPKMAMPMLRTTSAAKPR
jgi:hypothetical protein